MLLPSIFPEKVLPSISLGVLALPPEGIVPDWEFFGLTPRTSKEIYVELFSDFGSFSAYKTVLDLITKLQVSTRHFLTTEDLRGRGFL